MTEFVPFPKVPRLSREVIITEKLDGTNASVTIEDIGVEGARNTYSGDPTAFVYFGDREFVIYAGSRKRFITPGKGTDNFGFAAWVRDNAQELVKLGPGTHYGEWWGKGIQRGYGLDEKRFSLFNVSRWADTHAVGRYFGEPSEVSKMQWAPDCCHVVPLISQGVLGKTFLSGLEVVADAMTLLDGQGSYAAPGFMNPEGIMIYHTAARQYFKKTFENDAAGKEAA